MYVIFLLGTKMFYSFTDFGLLMTVNFILNIPLLDQ